MIKMQLVRPGRDNVDLGAVAYLDYDALLKIGIPATTTVKGTTKADKATPTSLPTLPSVFASAEQALTYLDSVILYAKAYCPGSVSKYQGIRNRANDIATAVKMVAQYGTSAKALPYVVTAGTAIPDLVKILTELKNLNSLCATPVQTDTGNTTYTPVQKASSAAQITSLTQAQMYAVEGINYATTYCPKSVSYFATAMALIQHALAVQQADTTGLFYTVQLPGLLSNIITALQAADTACNDEMDEYDAEEADTSTPDTTTTDTTTPPGNLTPQPPFTQSGISTGAKVAIGIGVAGVAAFVISRLL